MFAINLFVSDKRSSACDHVVKTQWKYYDAAVGDFTLLAERMQYVDFTFPYADSGMSLVVPVKLEGSGRAWMFMKPFTLGMWVATAAILVYTMLVVWLLERDQCNPEFSGPWKNQICTALWFTFSSLFFAHREKIYSNLSRLVIVLWLFVVLVLTSSYTANLSSMLIAQQLQPNVIDVEWLQKNNLKVGYNGNLRMRTYLENVLGFKNDNILSAASEYNYAREFERKHISAAFLEHPYDKVFLNKYCNDYIGTTLNDGFGGLGFIFQKGSPIVRDFSKAIMHLLDNGKLKALEDKWLIPMDECSADITGNKSQTLSLQSFWVLYLISFATSTICFLLSIICSPINRQNHEHAYEVTAPTLVDTAKINADSTLEPVESSTPAEIEMLCVSVQTSEPNKASSSETAANLSSKDCAPASPDDHVANLSR